MDAQTLVEAHDAALADGTVTTRAHLDGLISAVIRRERANVARELRECVRDSGYTLAHYADVATVDRIASEIERSR